MMNDKKTIFVIEDSQILSEIITLQIKLKFNCEVVVFNNGDNILNEIKNYSPDLIVLDYNYNGFNLNYKNGLEVIVELRKSYQIPVIVFSGQRDKEKAIEIIQKGANDYVSKDDDDFMNNLLDSMEDVLNIQKSKDRISKLRGDLNKGFIFLLLITIVAFSAFNYAYSFS